MTDTDFWTHKMPLKKRCSKCNTDFYVYLINCPVAEVNFRNTRKLTPISGQKNA